MIDEIKEKLSTLEKRLERLVRVGVVTQVYPEKGTVRVKIADLEDVVSYEMPVLVRKTCKDKDYWMPDIGEHVVCVFLPIGVEQGFVVGAFYSEVDKVPATSVNIKRIELGNGAYIEWNRETGTLKIFSPDEILIESGTHIVLVAPRIDLNP